MFDLDRWQEIWVTITRNKMRSILTAFGVFWGIFMLVVMTGSGTGLENGIMEGIRGFSTNSCFFWTNSTSEAYKGFRKGRNWNMKNGDIEIIRQKIPQIKYITPMVFGGNSPHNTVYKDKAGGYNIKGFYPVYDKIDHQQILYGRYINDIDVREKRKVAVIGRKVYEELFTKGKNPVGEMIKVNGMYYSVVGVINPITVININGSMEESVILPETTMQQAYNYGDVVHLLAITAHDNYKISEIEEEIKKVLKKEHSIAPDDAQAVSSVNLEKQFTMFHYLFLGIAILIWIVGLGTLFAGVVGVSNIMMVTVRERTKEIGVRRALGASPKVILMQIIYESLLLTLMSGVLGLCAGVGVLIIIDIYGYMMLLWIIIYVVFLLILLFVLNFTIVEIKILKNKYDLSKLINLEIKESRQMIILKIGGFLFTLTSTFLIIVFCALKVNELKNSLDLKSSKDNVFIAHPQIGFSVAIAALLILVFSGIISGLIPAWRALQIKAIDAIREE